MLQSIHVQVGLRSLDLPASKLARLPSLALLRHHARRLYPDSSGHRPVFLHNGEVVDDQRWQRLTSNASQQATLNLQLAGRFNQQEDATRASAQPTEHMLPEQQAPDLEQDLERQDYFAVRGRNGNTTLYLQKADFDRRIDEFAREGSLSEGVRLVFPPAYQEEYEHKFENAGATVRMTREATALRQRWHQEVAIGGGVISGLSCWMGTSLFASEAAAAEVAAESAMSLASESASAEMLADAGMAGRSVWSSAVAGAAAVAVGIVTFKLLTTWLPELWKEEYAVLISVPREDESMLELGIAPACQAAASAGDIADSTACILCFEKPSNAIAKPCKHAACSECLDKLRRRHWPNNPPCPRCRSPVVDIETFFP